MRIMFVILRVIVFINVIPWKIMFRFSDKIDVFGFRAETVYNLQLVFVVVMVIDLVMKMCKRKREIVLLIIMLSMEYAAVK